MPTETDLTPSRPDPPPMLEYGRGGQRRWPKRLLWATAFVAIAAGLYLLYGRVELWFARRAGTRNVVAWYQQARTSRIADGTLLYSENLSDMPLGVSRYTITGGGRPPRTYVTFDGPHTSLRRALYSGRGVPVVVPHDILFVHERRVWDVPNGTRNDVVSVSYSGLNTFGNPQFDVMAMNLGDGNPPFPMMGGQATVPGPITRSLANLRIFAGRIDPNDATRFALPFQCDGGPGRFEFKTDDDVSDGGKLTPDVWIEWELGTPVPNTTLPTSMPHGFAP